jgi:hypothetical protein
MTFSWSAFAIKCSDRNLAKFALFSGRAKKFDHLKSKAKKFEICSEVEHSCSQLHDERANSPGTAFSRACFDWTLLVPVE